MISVIGGKTGACHQREHAAPGRAALPDAEFSNSTAAPLTCAPKKNKIH